MESVDVFYSFRSPYSYLATPEMLRLPEEFAIDLHLRVVMPAALRNPETLFSPANAQRARYIFMDWARRARFLGMSDVWPDPDPIVQEKGTYKVAEEQPYIHRLSALGVEAERRGLGPEFAYEVAHVLFGGVKNWHEGGHLAHAAERAGLDLAEMEAAIAGGDHAAEIEADHAALAEAGHWGVPTFVVRGEPFFGQDRIDTLRWHLTNLGLKR